MSTVKRDHSEVLSLASLWLLLFALHVYYARNMAGPIILDDEFGYLANAAFFSGLDWSAIVTGITYYSFGYSLLLTPLFIVFDDSLWIYQSALTINSIAASCIPILAYYVVRRFAPTASQLFALTAALTLSLYPSYLVYANLAWAESLLVCGYWGTVLLSFRLVDQQNQERIYVAFGLLVGLLYAVHHRNIGIIVSAIVIVLLLQYIRINTRRSVALFICGLLGVLGITIATDLYLREKLWLGNVRGIGVLAKLASLGSLEGVRWLFITAIGQAFYLGVATYGLVFVGFGGAILSLWDTVKGLRTGASRNRQNDHTKIAAIPAESVAISYVTLTVLFTFLLSVLVLHDGHRADHILYGRYNEGVIGPLVLLGVLSVAQQIRGVGRWKWWMAVGSSLLLIVLGFLLFSLAQSELKMRETQMIPITGLFPYLERWRVNVSLTLGSVLSLSIIVLLACCWRPQVGLALLIMIFTWGGYTNMSGQLWPAAESLRRYEEITSWISEYDAAEQIYFLKSHNWRKDLMRERYQFWLPTKKLLPIDSLEEYKTAGGTHLLSAQVDVGDALPRAKLVAAEPDGGFGLWISSACEQDRLKKHNVRFLDASPFKSRPDGQLAKNAYQSRLKLLSDNIITVTRRSSVTLWTRPWADMLDTVKTWLGIQERIRLRVTHKGEGRWPVGVRVGIFWTDQGAPTLRLAEQRAFFPKLIGPGESVEVDFVPYPVAYDGTPLPPGEYEVHIGLVHENVTWFYQQGDEIVKLRVIIKG